MLKSGARAIVALVVAAASCLFGSKSAYAAYLRYNTDTIINSNVDVPIGTYSNGIEIDTGTVTVQSGGSWTLHGQGFFIISKQGTGNNGALVLDGATQALESSTNLYITYGGVGQNGSVTITNGGSLTTGGKVHVGYSNGGAYSATLTLEGTSSSLSVTGDFFAGGCYLSSGQYWGANGAVTQTGGAASFRNLYVAFPDATTYGVLNEANRIIGSYTISGGSLTVASGYALVLGGDPKVLHSSTFGVVGSSATISIDGGSGVAGTKGVKTDPNTMFDFTVDNGGVSWIDTSIIYGGAGSTAHAIAGTVDMHLDSGVTPTQNQYFLLIKENGSTTLDISGLSLSPDDSGVWALDTSVAGQLGAVYLLPEPGSIVLLAAGSVVIAFRRWKRRRR